MANDRILAERPRRESAVEPAVTTDRSVLATYEEDAARSHGTASGVARPRDEAEVAALLGRARRLGLSVLAQGARSSLTAGATPRGDLVLALEGLDRVLEVGPDWVRCEPGVRLRDLNERVLAAGLWFPPVPTYDLCCVGGAVSTNAAGAATWKHGAVRPWVRALRVVLASGEVLALRRGETRASAAGFAIESREGTIHVPLPRYRTPPLKKIACGYFVRDGLDLVDLFVGSEGTLGVVTEVELGLAPVPAAIVAGVASFADEARALAFASAVRAASEETWRTRSPVGLDMRSLELVDADSLELLRERGKATDGITLPARGGCFVLWEQELATALTDDAAALAIGSGLSGATTAGPLEALGALLAAHGAGEDVRVALPHDERGRRLIARVREVVPETVNELVAERKRTDPAIRKVAGDMVVPFERLPEMLSHYRERFRRRGLASAIWGHVSDGNLHPNVLARTGAESEAGEEALLELGAIARELGGAPLSEHGVGKSPTKQELLRRFYGDEALDDMARVKLALDPRAILAPGNIFPRERLSRMGASRT
jgi:D-lactate dehydrogenase (cytochrome)